MAMLGSSNATFLQQMCIQLQELFGPYGPQPMVVACRDIVADKIGLVTGFRGDAQVVSAESELGK
jgi:hypothetical protein